MEVMRDFCTYQVKAWKVFLRVEINGVDQAVEAYIQAHGDLARAVRGELAGKITYQDGSLKLVKKEVELERKFLEEVKAEKDSVLRIMSNFSKLSD